MKSKFIIHNDIGLPDDEAVALVYSVVRKGKISETVNGKQYCFVSSFNKADVHASMTATGAHSFKLRHPWKKKIGQLTTGRGRE